MVASLISLVKEKKSRTEFVPGDPRVRYCACLHHPRGLVLYNITFLVDTSAKVINLGIAPHSSKPGFTFHMNSHSIWRKIPGALCPQIIGIPPASPAQIQHDSDGALVYLSGASSSPDLHDINIIILTFSYDSLLRSSRRSSSAAPRRCLECRLQSLVSYIPM